MNPTPIVPERFRSAQKENGWCGEYYPSIVADTTYLAAREWVMRQRWSPLLVNEFWSLDTQADAVKWCEEIGVTFQPVHIGELPNAHQS